jgi:acyl dehydratase
VDAGDPIGPLGLRIGQRARRTQPVTARAGELYAEITGDRNPLHFDADFAAPTRFGALVAQLRATITNQDGTVVLEGECWTYTLRPA